MNNSNLKNTKLIELILIKPSVRINSIEVNLPARFLFSKSQILYLKDKNKESLMDEIYNLKYVIKHHSGIYQGNNPNSPN